jgi:large subunit ribosomal protein L6
MSRIGKMPVAIPQGVKVDIKPEEVTIEGPKGSLAVKSLPGVECKLEGEEIVVTRNNEIKRTRAFHGLFRKLLLNAVLGVSEGFSKTLLINGVGYRAEVDKDMLILNLGYSNPVHYHIPEGINIVCESNTKIVVSGIDKQQVGQVSAEIRSVRPPEPYKGKGVRYENESIIRKVGKAGVA